MGVTKKISLYKIINIAVFKSRNYLAYLAFGILGELIYRVGVYLSFYKSNLEWLIFISFSSIFIFNFLFSLLETFIESR